MSVWNGVVSMANPCSSLNAQLTCKSTRLLMRFKMFARTCSRPSASCVSCIAVHFTVRAPSVPSATNLLLLAVADCCAAGVPQPAMIAQALRMSSAFINLLF